MLWGCIGLIGVLLAGCSSSSSISNDLQDIVLDKYSFSVSQEFTPQSLEDYADPRVAWRFIAMYASTSQSWYKDNMVVSKDILPPDTTLEQYASSSFEAIASTWRNSTILSTSSRSFHCQALTTHLKTQSFQLNRFSSQSLAWETLYFVQWYILQDKSIVIVSLSTSNKKNVSILEDYIDSVSCAR